jgi:hypothetical protein
VNACHIPLALVIGLPALGAACGARHTGPPPVARGAAAVIEPPGLTLSAHKPRIDSDPDTYSACAAPSVLRLHAADDTDDPGVTTCAPGDAWSIVPNQEEATSVRCGAAGRPDLVARALSGALPLDAATTEHVRAIYGEGQKQGRRGHAFGLVGDSMTTSGSFMRPFSSPPRTWSPPLEQALSAVTGGDVVEFFHGMGNDSFDSFVAPRAAKVGVRATWPLQPRTLGAKSPLVEMVDRVSPAYAVVLYGANDALWRTDSLPRLRDEFTTALAAIVDALESRGVVAVVTTIPKHMRERGWPDCPRGATTGSNERFAANATALSAAVADLACTRHLPLIDLRWALDPLLDHGVGPDGVHLSTHSSGGGVLDDSGLQCGNNVRNLVTLRELTLVIDAVATDVW